MKMAHAIAQEKAGGRKKEIPPQSNIEGLV
jgi:hypothetical protein